jgi:hypothetical protein
MSTSPAVEVIDAFVRFVNSPVPERVMFPVALIAPVGLTEDPPMIRIVPEEAVSDPAPT